MRWIGRPGVALFLGVVLGLSGAPGSCLLDIPLEVEQLPTITAQSPNTMIAFPFDESYSMKCNAKGNPDPEFRWTKNGLDFDPEQDPRLMLEDGSGTFIIPNNGNLTEFQGVYRCYASNKLGTAMSEEIEFLVPHVPKFPKEKIDPIEVEEGQPVTLQCDPPKGIPPLHIYWMTIGLVHIEQDERVTIGLNGNLYFANTLERDSRRDYCCFASFPRIRTIVQKTAMSLVVRNTKTDSGSDSGHANSILKSKPSLLSPPGAQTYKHLVKGETLMLECIPAGYPTPKVEWIKVGHGLPKHALVENHAKVLRIPNVQQEDEGQYKCTAKNGHGGDTSHLFHVTVEDPPQWTAMPESQINMIGSDVVIKCVATGNPKPTISWRVNGQSLDEVPAANRKVFENKIILERANSSDSAVYQCEASNKHGTILANANIMIMNLPPVMVTEDSVQYSAVQGRNIMMHCKTFSSPPSDITWSKEDSADSVTGSRFSLRNNGSLEISAVEEGDMGEYSCIAKNREGSRAISAFLEIKEPTKIVEPPLDLRILVGTTAQFVCQAEFDRSFNHEMETYWLKDGVVISLNDTETNSYLVEEDGVLQIANVSYEDQGRYSCVVRSPVDQDIASAHLIVMDVPDAPEDLMLSELSGKSVKLKWIPGEDHNSSTTEFVIEFEESQREPGIWRETQRVPGSHTSALLKLHGHADYRFRVSAVNEVGQGRPSEPSENYKTPARAPDKNPENIKIEGHLPHEMDINWEPLAPIEHNGPGLEYKVSYRQQQQQGAAQTAQTAQAQGWQEHLVKRHSFVVKDTPTFVPYEIKIQARNHKGWGPEPRVIVGYSGEDFPSAAPDNVAVEVVNNTLVKVSWERVHKDKLHGHLGGYRVNWWRLRSLLTPKKSHGEKNALTFPGDRSHTVVPGLRPFSEYSLIVMAFNGRGNGPGSHPVTFRTPEGVPDQVSVLRITSIKKHSVSLSWSPPIEPNGILTGYLLQYQLINDTEEVGPMLSVNVSDPDTSKWLLQDLEALSKYKFYLQACSRLGCGPAASEECSTTPEASRASIHGGISTQGWFIGVMCAIALLTLIVLIACFVNRNKGGKYSVKEKEDLHPDVESQGMNDDTFCEYSDNDEKPLKGSLHSHSHSASGELKAAETESGDSMVDYGEEEEGQFNEDGSFIGEYTDRNRRNTKPDNKPSQQDNNMATTTTTTTTNTQITA
ncbi:neural cell adhesion molecule L1-like protein isoform X2 [Engraulis encrasicolus]|uniref:neural cell adhesion molecule L1-like protein isoform X2 n=1 Tax=Engraulis encrasicolus TaxID=184585 RepID=UPI002FD6A083